MDSRSSKIIHDFPPFLIVYDDGNVERYMTSPLVPPGLDLNTGVESLDVSVSEETGQKVRIFKPKTDDSDQKLPLVIHYHGGAFCLGSPFGPATTTFLSSLVSESGLMAVSVGYRLAPENPLPIAYEDSWYGLRWIMSHCLGQGPDQWLNKYADFGRVFLVGESAGANLAHYVAVRCGVTRLVGVNLRGLVLVHPYFATKKPDELIRFLYPTSNGSEDDPKLSPKSDPDLAKMGCEEVLVYVAENDSLKERGLNYCEILKKSGWGGKLELVENKNEGHCFHLFNPSGENVGPLMQKLIAFIKQR